MLQVEKSDTIDAKMQRDHPLNAGLQDANFIPLIFISKGPGTTGIF